MTTDKDELLQQGRDSLAAAKLLLNNGYSLPSVELYTKARIIDEQGRAIKSNKL